jgi:hypothetical protein
MATYFFTLDKPKMARTCECHVFYSLKDSTNFIILESEDPFFRQDLTDFMPMVPSQKFAVSDVLTVFLMRRCSLWKGFSVTSWSICVSLMLVGD